ncbi:hypothetical protein E4T42_07306 [Aureobasidium subglaciale]|uniref:Uncharacterized protein n=1 Tax=Aureobasidium subglaciale (strain EXF-2481) TaxID=1043005 RepID=A0A074Y6Y7_AURSE|nr:uncharacterized protein AUEXF2481DRAFT_31060 [Aureobasidium subglaciale EXF-2481]KAI5212778.1 hypothetical protein E4T38_00205 [Aureobasidium subglaciale]KAI5232577.1 hypothetical protein E4T40_00204 [Aureobasidium subglaciale]KAI5234624.1 hypothetical protein E4T41_00204 [Aureobasidium subglaciale]KAI5243478.1 hypothetical protein E4T42_07306 [Aureobasidium subglaciale]KAI5268271.1 hypothetical protein E4T46_00204 [Aureobasidium subglaciale]
MSLVRAFTTRRAARNNKSDLNRTASQRTQRPKISGPIELISTTNTLAHEAPDIFGTKPIAFKAGVLQSSSSSNSLSSLEYSDSSSIGHRSGGTFTDASSFEESPLSPEPNHLSCYFKPSVYDEATQHSRQTSVNSFHRTSTSDVAPVLPQRAPSHSKRAHQLSHKRSVSRVNPPSFPEDAFVTRDSTDFFRASGPTSPHPFGKELEQLNEVAEEFGTTVRDVEADADRVFMDAHGLDHFSADDYMMEIADMLNVIFEDEPTPYEEAGWI